MLEFSSVVLPTLYTSVLTNSNWTIKQRYTDNALADYQLANIQRLTIGRLPINTESYKNLTFLHFEIKRLKSC